MMKTRSMYALKNLVVVGKRGNAFIPEDPYQSHLLM